MAFDKNKTLGKAQKLIQQGKLQKAIEEFQKIVDFDPADIRTTLKIGDLNAKIGNIEAASDTYKRVAEHYAKDGFFLKAIAVFKQILKLDPGVINVYLRLAELYNQLGLNSEAMKQYQIVVKHYENKGMKKESLDVLKKMANLDPDNVASKVKLAELYAKEGYKDQAAEQFATVAGELKEKNNFEDLIKVLEKLTSMNPKDFEVLKELSEVYLKVGEPKKALAKLQVCFKANPKEPSTLELLAQSFVDLQQPEKAKSVYRELIAVYEEQGMIEQKDQALERLKREFPEDSYQASMSSSLGSSSSQAPSSDSDLLNLDADAQEVSKTKEDPLKKLISEVEVYVKYGLFDKAVENIFGSIQKIENKEPLLEKLREIYSEHSSNKTVANALSTGLAKLRSDGQESLANLLEKSAKGDVEASVEAVAESSSDEEIIEEDEVMLDESSLVVEEAEDLAVEGNQIPKGDKGPKIEFSEDVADGKSQELSASLEEEMLRDDEGQDKIELSVFEVKEEDLKEEPLSLEPREIKEVEVEDSASSDENVVAPSDELEELPDSSMIDAPLEDAKESPSKIKAAAKYKDEMEEADFFIKQGLLEEAKYIYESIIEAEPDFLEAKDKLKEIDAILSKDKKSKSLSKEKIEDLKEEPMPSPDTGEDLFDLGKELSEEIVDINRSSAKSAEEKVLTFDEMFSQFKEGVAKSLSKTDYQAHYDLGVAYKEMGLLEDSIKEFKTSLADDSLKISCISMMGIVYLSKGDFDNAVSAFETGVKETADGSDENLSFLFDLAEAYSKKGDNAKALEILKGINSKKSSFREVSKKIKDLESLIKAEEAGKEELNQKGFKDSDDDENGGEDEDGGKKDKISYI